MNKEEIANKKLLVFKYDDSNKCCNFTNHINLYYSVMKNHYGIIAEYNENLLKGEYYIYVFYNRNAELQAIKSSILAILN